MPVADQLAADGAVVGAEEIPLGMQDAGAGPLCEARSTEYSLGRTRPAQPADIVQNSRCVRGVLIKEAGAANWAAIKAQARL